jgi:hypothetical protein
MNHNEKPSDSKKGSTEDYKHYEDASSPSASTMNRIATHDHIPLYNADTGK